MDGWKVGRFEGGRLGGGMGCWLDGRRMIGFLEEPWLNLTDTAETVTRLMRLLTTDESCFQNLTLK